MRFKKFVCFIVFTMIAASLFAGCGQSQNPGSVGTDTGAQTGTKTAEPEKTAAEPEKIVFVQSAWGDRTADHPTFQAVREKIKEAINVDVQWAGRQNDGNIEEKIKMMLASGEQIDCFYTNDWMPFWKAESIIPLNDLLNKYGQDLLKNSIPESFKIRTTEDGNTWSVPWEQYPVSYATMIRKDWLDELGLQVPTTIEEMENVLKTFKDKKKDVGIIPAWNTLLEEEFAGSFIPTGNQNWVDTDGKLKPFYLHPKFKDYLTKMQDWYKKGLIFKEIATISGQQYTDTVNASHAGVFMYYVDSSTIETGILAPIKNNDPKAEIAFIPPLKGTEPGMFKKDLPPGWGSCITKVSKHPKAAMKFLNYVLATKEGHLLSLYGIEETNWIWEDKDNGILKQLDGLKPEEQYINEQVYIPGYLISLAGKYSMGKIGRDWMNWLNDENNVRSSYSVDFGVVYDVSIYKSKDMISALDTLRTAALYKIIMGQKPVSYWDDTMKDWLSKGGSLYIDDITAQYNEYKAKHKQ